MKITKIYESIRIYKGEGRILVAPVVLGHESQWCISMQLPVTNIEVGNAIYEAKAFIQIEEAKQSSGYNYLKKSASSLNTKYKTRHAFVMNNDFGSVDYLDEGILISSRFKSREFVGQYGDICKDMIIPLNSTADEIGAAIIDVMNTVEDYYVKNPQAKKISREDSIELLDQSILKIKKPRNKNFEDYNDCGAAEIYKCYCYISPINNDALADMFLGTAAELNCSLESENIAQVWTQQEGAEDYFDVKQIDKGIYNIRAEYKNKAVHRISYFRQMNKDLLLECGFKLYQPNRKKKLDEKLTKEFEEFAENCKL